MTKTRNKTTWAVLAALALMLGMSSNAAADPVGSNDTGTFIIRITPNVDLGVLVDTLGAGWKDGGNLRIVVCHAVSLLLIAVIAGMGMADGGDFAGTKALLAYAPAQAVWLVINLIYARGRRLNEKEAN